MAEGRWLDDAYAGEPRTGRAGPRLVKFGKLTWPLLFALTIAGTALVGQAGWLLGMIVYAGMALVPLHFDRKAENEGRP